MKSFKRVCAWIHLDAVTHNMNAMKEKLAPDTRILAVIKTDGYGHGAVEIAQEIENMDFLYGFAVATAEEAFVLRRHGVKKPIMILGYTFAEDYEELIRRDIELCVFTLDMAEEISRMAMQLEKDVKIHVKIDTGMRRIGMEVCEETALIIEQMTKLPHIRLEGVFTHFAKADEANKDATMLQMSKFRKMIAMIEERGIQIPLKHCSNSAAIVDIPEANMDLVRAGIILYGLWPSEEVEKAGIDLKPVMELKSHIVHVKKIPAGEGISYGGTFVTKQDTIVATVPVGYGDGYPRGLSNVGYVLIHGKKAPILGRVCMDQFMIDVTEVSVESPVCVGDEVTLLGIDGEEQITMEELGVLSERFNYEFACTIGKRIPRVFLRNKKIVSYSGSSSTDYFV